MFLFSLTCHITALKRLFAEELFSAILISLSKEDAHAE
jgi:hypothetical protein